MKFYICIVRAEFFPFRICKELDIFCLEGVDADHRGAGPARDGRHHGPEPHEPPRRPQDRVQQGEDRRGDM
jgi:hypothetical protein